MATSATARRSRGDPATTDVDRFRQQARHGATHAYAALLGLETLTTADALRAIGKGVPYRSFERLRRSARLSIDRLADLVGVPRRTMTRRKAEGRFSPAESDRLFRVARLLGAAIDLFEGDVEAASDWLLAAQPALGGTVPLDLARSEVGVREVEQLIGRLEHGVFV